MIWQVKYFFAKSGNISKYVDHMTRAKLTLRKCHKQEYGSFMGAEDIQLNEQTPAPMHLGSGKQSLPISKLDFSYNCGNNANVLPLEL